jgi:hypothetical protein
MASRKNRSRNPNRKSPKAAAGWRDRLAWRWRGLVDWAVRHRWQSIAVAFAVLFFGSLVGGYWFANKLDSLDRDRLARDTLGDMKRDGGTEKYASIDQIPGLPHYTETDPGFRGGPLVAAQRRTVSRSPQPASDRYRD